MNVAKQLFPPSPGIDDAQNRTKRYERRMNGHPEGSSYQLGCKGATFSLLLCLGVVCCTVMLNSEWVDITKEGKKVVRDRGEGGGGCVVYIISG